MGQPYRGLQTFIQDLHPVMLFHSGSDSSHHQNALFLTGLGNLDHLEPAGEGRVLFNVLLVLGPGGGGDGSQSTAGEGGL